jgi:hypothetical protein
MRPGDAPLANLAAALADLMPASDDAIADAGRLERFLFTLRQSRFGIGQLLDSMGNLAGAELLLLVDQFEELFRYAAPPARGAGGRAEQAAGREEAIQFVQLLLQAARDPSRPVHVLLTMRSDFIGDCARFHGLPEAVSANQFLVPSLTRDQLEAVIRRPIEKAQAAIEPALVERLLNDAGDELDELPVLQHCVQRVWEEAQKTAGRGKRPRLTLAHYNAIGGLAQALSRHADEVLASLPGDELAVEQVFPRLIRNRPREPRHAPRPALRAAPCRNWRRGCCAAPRARPFPRRGLFVSGATGIGGAGSHRRYPHRCRPRKSRPTRAAIEGGPDFEARLSRPTRADIPSHGQ